MFLVQHELCRSRTVSAQVLNNGDTTVRQQKRAGSIKSISFGFLRFVSTTTFDPTRYVSLPPYHDAHGGSLRTLFVFRFRFNTLRFASSTPFRFNREVSFETLRFVSTVSCHPTATYNTQPLCPVASFNRYISALPLAHPYLSPHPSPPYELSWKVKCSHPVQLL